MGSAEVVSVAWPSVSPTVSSALSSLVKVTVPVGVPAGGVTVAVNVTAWPGSDEVSTVVVAAVFGVWVSVLVLGAMVVFPA
jgi:hypothetical protein